MGATFCPVVDSDFFLRDEIRQNEKELSSKTHPSKMISVHVTASGTGPFGTI